MVDGFNIDLKCWLFMTLYSHVFCLRYTDYEAKIFRCCSFTTAVAVLACARGMVNSKRAISSAKSRSFNTFTG